MAARHSQEMPHTLTQLVDRLDDAAREAQGEGKVRMASIVEEVGSRSLGPLLLLAGLVTLMPLVGDIPGVPTMMALLVLLVAGQLLAGRSHFWLPEWLLARSVEGERLSRALGWVRKPARWVDRLLKPRLAMLVRGPGEYAIAVACVLVALAMPPMELVPFTANGAGLVLTAFGLALIARDGLFALFGHLATAGILGFLGYQLLT